MTTAADLINGSLRLLGVLAEGETPSAESASDALMAFNQMVDSWSTERLAVFTNTTSTVIWPAGLATATLGPTGTLAGTTRPTLLGHSSYVYDPQTRDSYPLTLLNLDQYASITDKYATADRPTALFYEAGFPDGSLTLYPVPSKAVTLKLSAMTPLAGFAQLTTQIGLPPGYLRALRYNLALELSSEFGVEPGVEVKRIAMISKRNLKRINNPMDVLEMPRGLPGQRAHFNIYSGAF